MFTRRVFLQSAFALSGLSLWRNAFPGLITGSSHILVIAEDSCPDTQSFAQCLPANHIGLDPAQLLTDIEGGIKTAEYDAVFGLTRDSNYVLLEQTVRASSYRLYYEGRHRYSATGLLHRLTADKVLIRELKTQIEANADDWVKTITQIPATLNHDRQNLIRDEIQTKTPCPDTSPGYLVSWLFVRSLS